jgi:PTS system glucose-specific IIC component
LSFRGTFGFLQKIGSALMVPVAVLPVAGLMLGIGAGRLPFIPTLLSTLMEQSGGVIFTCLPLIFAIAVALSFGGNDSVNAISAVIGYVVMLATMGGMVELWGIKARPVLGIASIDTGVFGGILAGGVAAVLYKRFHKISLPRALAFFAGKRFVPIVTAFAALVLGVVLSFIWPVLQGGIDRFSHWAAVSDPRTAATLYGLIERLLIPFGLHHIWNVPFFFELGAFTDSSGRVVHGEIARFFAGDRTAGTLGGAFLFKMFGLPGAAIAMWRAALPANRLRVGGIMASAALTSFLTGITEPIEFAFLFAAPPLYLIHAVLAAGSQFLANTLDMHLGFTFSQGAIDLAAFNVFSATSRNAWLLLVLGPLWGFAYYGIFSFAIRRFNLHTPGRELETGEAHPPAPSAEESEADRALSLVLAFGGESNITGLDACVTRLRISVKDPGQVDAERLKSMGATAVMMVGTGIQAIFGPASEGLKSDIEEYLKSASQEPESRPMPARPVGGGNLAVAATLARIAHTHGTMSEDLAQARQRERLLEKNLEHGKRLAGLGGVVAGVAHDLRTPITGIKLTLDGLVRRRLDAASMADLDVCVDELGRLDRLVGQLMVVARSGSEEKQWITLEVMVDERLQRFKERGAQRGITLRREGSAGLKCNADTLTRVVDNLVGNALDASPTGGEVLVRLEQDAGEVRIAVEDHGDGVPAAHEHEIFEPFFTLKRDGTGLGLFLSHALIVVQGGSLSYRRHPTATSFTVGLPTQVSEVLRVANSGR